MYHVCWPSIVAALIAPLALALGEDSKSAITPQQRRETQALLTEFRASRKSPEKRSAAVDKAIEVGEPAVLALLDLVGKELQPLLKSYRDRFFAQAVSAAEAKFKAANPQEIAQLRRQVLDMSQRPELSKEMIVQLSDPAMKRLTEVLVLERETVLSASAPLQKQRDAMQELGGYWERLMVHLAKQDARDAPNPQDAQELPSFERYLQQEEELAAQMAVPMDAATRNVLATNARSLAPQLDPEEARCVLALNLMRNLLGLPPLLIDMKLTAAARGHSADMEAHRFFDHTSPVPGKTTPWDRARLAGTTASAENIYMGRRDGASANAAWWHSPGHHKNMLGDHARVGMGRHGRYWSELFGR